MKFYGIDSKGIIKIQEVEALPTWVSDYERRIVYNKTDKLVYYGKSDGWSRVIDHIHTNKTVLDQLEIVDGKLNFDGESISLFVISTNTTFYVSVNGDDINGDGTQNNPWGSLHKALDYLNDYIIMPATFVTIQVGVGVHSYTQVVEFYHEQGEQIIIKGEVSYEIHLTSLLNVTTNTSGYFKTWTCTFVVSDISNMTTDDYLSIHTITTPASGLHCILGCHKIISVDPILSTVTVNVKHSSISTNPSNQVCAIQATLHKVIIDFENVVVDSRNRKIGFFWSEAQNASGIRRLEQMVIVGPGYIDGTNNYGIYQHGPSRTWIANIGIVNWARGIFIRNSTWCAFKNANDLVDNNSPSTALAIVVTNCFYGMFTAGATGSDGDAVSIFSGCTYGLAMSGINTFFNTFRNYIVGCPYVAIYGEKGSSCVVNTSIEGCGTPQGLWTCYAVKNSYLILTVTDLGNNHATMYSPAANTLGNENSYIDTP